tara:strand:- start:31 stop:375 length:345 start_codon:yes stop_codon:yes gene_type:complete
MWHRKGNEGGQWEVLSLKSHEVDMTMTKGDYCRNDVNGEQFTKEEADVSITDNGMFERGGRKLSVEWVRPFDIDVSHGLTLVGGFKYNIWYTFVVVDESSPERRIYQYGLTRTD